ncbi:hypothetical protein GQ44DRAFT_713094 [Phaeosphaeriaceae sp. PMI808]|nr:hypothetical protein GQ44DRAFT_713094 [Phaeosphaeriaceae sp. PMI808]
MLISILSSFYITSAVLHAAHHTLGSFASWGGVADEKQRETSMSLLTLTITRLLRPDDNLHQHQHPLAKPKLTAGTLGPNPSRRGACVCVCATACENEKDGYILPWHHDVCLNGRCKGQKCSGHAARQNARWKPGRRILEVLRCQCEIDR